MPICWNLQIRWVVERLALAPVFCWFSRFDPILEDRLNFWWVWSLQEALVEGGTQSNGIKWNHTFLQFGICVFNGPFLKKNLANGTATPSQNLRWIKLASCGSWLRLWVPCWSSQNIAVNPSRIPTFAGLALKTVWVSWSHVLSKFVYLLFFLLFLYFFSYFYIMFLACFCFCWFFPKGKRCCIASTNENFLDFAAWLLIATVPQFAGLRCPPWVNGSPCAPCHENLFDHLENTSLTGDIFSIGFIPSTYHCDPAIAHLDTRNCCKGNYLWIQ